MKKFLMTIAIMAVSACMMAACGNKSANTGEASGEAAVEAADDNSPAMQLLNSVPFRLTTTIRKCAKLSPSL